MTRPSVDEGIKENYYDYHEFLMKYTSKVHLWRAIWLSECIHSLEPSNSDTQTCICTYASRQCSREYCGYVHEETYTWKFIAILLIVEKNTNPPYRHYLRNGWLKKNKLMMRSEAHNLREKVCRIIFSVHTVHYHSWKSS